MACLALPYISTLSHKRPIVVAARSTAARLLGLRFRIPPGARMSVSLECCQSLRWADLSSRKCPTECGVSVCDREAWTMRRPWRISGCCDIKSHIRHDFREKIIEHKMRVFL